MRKGRVILFHFCILYYSSRDFDSYEQIVIWLFLFLSGHKWRSHRKLIAPTFHLNVLKGFIDLFNENSRQVIKKLNAELGKTFDAHDHMSEATVEILLGKNNFNAFYVFLIHLFIHQN